MRRTIDGFLIECWLMDWGILQREMGDVKGIEDVAKGGFYVCSLSPVKTGRRNEGQVTL